MRVCKYKEDFKYPDTGVHFHMHTAEFPLHSHDYYEFFFVISGSSTQVISDTRYDLVKGDGIFIFPENVHSVNTQNSEDYRIINMMITEAELKRLIELVNPNFFETLIKEKTPIKITLSSRDIAMYEDALHQIQTSKNNKDTYVTFVRVMWVNTISLLYKKSIVNNTEYPEWLNEFLTKLLDLKNIVLPVKELYKLTYFSHSYFDKLFKQYLGMSLKSYLVNVKMEYAANLLEHTDIKVIDIVEELGYSSVSHFNYTFKKYFGKSPSEYKKFILSK